MKSAKLVSAVAALTLTGAVLGGCACTGALDREQIGSFRPGVTSREDVVAALGAPDSVSRYGDGTTLLQWLDLQAGLIAYRSGHLAILFNDKTGKMVRITHHADTAF